jgi:hypothetical protein
VGSQQAEASAESSGPAIPRSPPGQYLSWLLEQLEASATDPMEFEVERRFSASFLEQLPAQRVVQQIRQLRSDLAPVALVRVDAATQDALTATVRASSGQMWTISLSLDTGDKNRLMGFSVKPAAHAQAH